VQSVKERLGSPDRLPSLSFKQNTRSIRVNPFLF
jgi:hypothetical protein